MGCAGSKKTPDDAVVATPTPVRAEEPKPSTSKVEESTPARTAAEAPAAAEDPAAAEAPAAAEELAAATSPEPPPRNTANDVWWGGKVDESERASQRQLEGAREAEQAEFERLSAKTPPPPPPRASRASRSSSGGEYKAKHQTTSQIKASLRERGIETPEGASRAELLQMEAEASGRADEELPVKGLDAGELEKFAEAKERLSSFQENRAAVEHALADKI